jgi:hypothetical protein
MAVIASAKIQTVKCPIKSYLQEFNLLFKTYLGPFFECLRHIEIAWRQICDHFRLWCGGGSWVIKDLTNYHHYN